LVPQKKSFRINEGNNPLRGDNNYTPNIGKPNFIKHYLGSQAQIHLKTVTVADFTLLTNR
jgi:hypothetical protein